jgi:hypothetical protein
MQLNLFYSNKFNLFCVKATEFLLSDELDSYPTKMRLKPLIDFLVCNFDMLKQKLCPNLFAKFIRLLWNCFFKVNFYCFQYIYVQC